MNKLLITSILFALVLIAPKASYGATFQEVECTPVYGGGVVCGVKTHETVDTAISDYINPSVIGAGFVFASGALFVISKKLKAQSI